MPTAEIVSQGDEVVTGQTVDTNAAWLAERLTELGFEVLRHRTVGDRVAQLVSTFSEVEADVLVCTGGLGPTDDDLTAETVSKAYQAPLALDEEALAHLTQLYAHAGRPMAESNHKQVWFPSGSRRLDNDRGTAPGFAIESPGGALVACMPGVPFEMRAMFYTQLRPLLLERFHLQPAHLVTLRTAGVGESQLQQRIGRFDHPQIVLGYRTSLTENEVKLRAPAGIAPEELTRVVGELHEAIGSPVFAIDGLEGERKGHLAEIVGHTLSTIESCSGGLLAAHVTEVPGSSAWFLEGAVTYSNAAKTRVAGLPEAMFAEHGAVSEPVARAMAEGMRRAAGTTFALSSTGIAGPGGGSEHKPVGTVHIALATQARTWHRLLRLPGRRPQIQARTAASALDLLRRHLQGLLD